MCYFLTEKHRLETIEAKLTKEYQNSLTKVKTMLDEMAIKHDREVDNWLFINKNLTGVPRWFKVRMLKKGKRMSIEKRLRQDSVEEGPELGSYECPGGRKITAEERLSAVGERLPTNDVSHGECILESFPIQEESNSELN